MLKISEQLRDEIVKYIKNTPAGQFNGNSIIQLINILQNLQKIEQKSNDSERKSRDIEQDPLDIKKE